MDQLYDFIITNVLQTPWNIHTHVAPTLSVELLNVIIDKWSSLQGSSHDMTRAGILLSLLGPSKKKLPLDLKTNAEVLISMARKDSCEAIRLVAQALGSYIDKGHLRMDLEDVSPKFSSDLKELKEFFEEKSLSFLPTECRYMSVPANTALGCSTIESEGLVFTSNDSIPELDKRIESYGIDLMDSKQDSGTSSLPLPPINRRTSGGFLRRSSGFLGSKLPKKPSIVSPKQYSLYGYNKESFKAKVLDLNEVNNISQEMANEKKRLEEEKCKRQQEKEEAKVLKRKAIEEEKQKKLEARDRLKKEEEETAQEEKKRKLKPTNDEEKEQENQEEKPAPIVASAGVLEIIGESTIISPEELKKIEDFLQGKYKIHDEIVEIKLCETPIEGNRREVILLLLDYSHCMWRKVKKTMSVHPSPEKNI